MAKRLKTANDVRRYLANLINKIENNDIEPSVASKLGYLINILLKAIDLQFQHGPVTQLTEEIFSKKQTADISELETKTNNKLNKLSNELSKGK